MSRAGSNPQIVLRPQDLLILLRLALEPGVSPGYAQLGAELGITASETHGALERAVTAQLAFKEGRGKVRVARGALSSFVLHGARYCFPAIRGGMVRGMPTSYAAPPLKTSILPGNEPVPVWPFKHGQVRGNALFPLYPSVPEAASRNPALYELLALFDGLRAGNARERGLAAALLEQRLQA